MDASTYAPRHRRRARANLTATPLSVHRSRELVEQWLTAWSTTDLVPVSKVIVTTLVENVLQHTDSAPSVRLELKGDTVTVAVEDGSRTPPTLSETRLAADVPTGLRIVDALSRAWGNAPTDEFSALFNTILINVTAFFRDPPAWDFVRDAVVPAMLAERGPSDPIRVWSAGCASGQEAYTLAMILAEAMGADEFRQRVKVYATDIDEEALSEARAASYDAKAVESVPPELLERYFEHANGRYVFRKDLRRAVIFGRNDLVKDAPISRVDLLVCRNTLMYLNAETQRTVLGRLHFALAPQGTLLLGHAEMLLSHADRFTPLNLKHRIFRKAAARTPVSTGTRTGPRFSSGAASCPAYHRSGSWHSGPALSHRS